MGGSVLARVRRAAGVALVAGMGIAISGMAHSAGVRFGIHASLAPATSVHAGAGGIGLQAQLTARPGGLAGGGYTLSGSVTQPQACTSDLIFMDGFDP
jgi:hypothetical protein